MQNGFVEVDFVNFHLNLVQVGVLRVQGFPVNVKDHPVPQALLDGELARLIIFKNVSRADPPLVIEFHLAELHIVALRIFGLFVGVEGEEIVILHLFVAVEGKF